MTEMSPVTHLVPPASTVKKPGSIGPPVPGTECQLVDPETGRVAPHKRVRAIKLVAEIPKSPSGKILRRLLRDREHVR